jgi:hypothetical protein
VNQARENSIAGDPQDCPARAKLPQTEPIPTAIPDEKSMESSSRQGAILAEKSRKKSSIPGEGKGKWKGKEKGKEDGEVVKETQCLIAYSQTRPEEQKAIQKSLVRGHQTEEAARRDLTNDVPGVRNILADQKETSRVREKKSKNNWNGQRHN